MRILIYKDLFPISPLRTIKSRTVNYTISDVDALYCPSEGPVNNIFNGELELDPEIEDCDSSRPVFATCKNTCPGGERYSLKTSIFNEFFLVNFPIVAGQTKVMINYPNLFFSK